MSILGAFTVAFPFAEAAASSADLGVLGKGCPLKAATM